MKEAGRLGVPRLKSQGINFLVHFKNKDTKTVSFNNVRQPFERLVSSDLEDDNGELKRFKRAGFEHLVTDRLLMRTGRG